MTDAEKREGLPSLTKAEILPPEQGAPQANVFRLRAADGVIYYAYRHPHPAVAATVVVRDTTRDVYLLVRRQFEPYAGRYAFPGGFLEVGRERIEETAAREVFEETGLRVSPEQMRLIDVRSDPHRDPRDHVLDIAYYVEVQGAEAIAGEETTEAYWATGEEVATLSLAFDHGQLWKHFQDWRQQML